MGLVCNIVALLRDPYLLDQVKAAQREAIAAREEGMAMQREALAALQSERPHRNLGKSIVSSALSVARMARLSGCAASQRHQVTINGTEFTVLVVRTCDASQALRPEALE